MTWSRSSAHGRYLSSEHRQDRFVTITLCESDPDPELTRRATGPLAVWERSPQLRARGDREPPVACLEPRRQSRFRTTRWKPTGAAFGLAWRGRRHPGPTTDTDLEQTGRTGSTRRSASDCSLNDITLSNGGRPRRPLTEPPICAAAGYYFSLAMPHAND